MKSIKSIIVILAAFIIPATSMAADTSAELDNVLQGSQREAKNATRDI